MPGFNRRNVHAGRRSMASPFMTGPLAPAGILNLVRASSGISPDSTFPENALGYRFCSRRLSAIVGQETGTEHHVSERCAILTRSLGQRSRLASARPTQTLF